MVSLLSGPLAWADSKYPASDFKPSVQYQDAEYIAKSKTTGTVGGQTRTPPDAKYPATSFQPKVLYKDEDYKHSTPDVPPKTGTNVDAASRINEAPATVAEEKTESNANYLIALIVLALVGFVFMRKRSSPKTAAQQGSPAYSSDAGGMTGVDKYLQRTQGAATTGVARYLEKQVAAVKEKAVTTGVAKYLEKKMVESETGVSKYLRNKG